MNATVQDMLKQYEMQVKVETLREVAERIQHMAMKYEQLICNDTAFGIYMQSHGTTLDRLTRQRGYLRSKSQMMWMLSGQLIREAQRLNHMRMK